MKFTIGSEMSVQRSSVSMAEGVLARRQSRGRVALYRLDVLVTSLSALLVACSIISVAINNLGVHTV